jgi:hypothetical protein
MIFLEEPRLTIRECVFTLGLQTVRTLKIISLYRK